MKVTFVTIADEKFSEPLKTSIAQISKIYPESDIHVYDWGLSKTTKEALTATHPRIKIQPWTLRFIDINIDRTPLFVFKKSLSLTRDALFMLLGIKNNSRSIESLLMEQKFEMKIYNKFLCLQDFHTTHQQKFVFLDADAFLINPIDELLDGSIDLGVTRRRDNELDYTFNSCAILNAGVMLFLGAPLKNQAIFNGWEEEIKKNREVYCEQTSLTRMLLKKDPEIFNTVDTKKSITINKELISVGVLDCEQYNYNWIEEFKEHPKPETVKVLHFKSGRFTTPLFKEIATALHISI